MVSLVASMVGCLALRVNFDVLHKYYMYDTALQCHYRFLASKQQCEQVVSCAACQNDLNEKAVILEVAVWLV